ncbi:MAG TPA: c-type cytochrome [Steroidobacteraceae bacterium]|nr:c-type cytochrome [Steroidobacteraceae bacterium]
MRKSVCGIAALVLATGGLPVVMGQAAGTRSGAPPAPAGIFGQATFPDKQRPAGDPAVIARGQALFGINCKSCHGVDLRGGDLGGPNLLRSALVLGDRQGEAIVPVVQKGRPASQGGPPMPPFSLALSDVQAIVQYIHSVEAKKQNQGGPPPIAEQRLNILVGDPARGKQYFAAHCQECHSADTDLKGIATRVSNPATLQDSWVAGRSSARSAGAAPAPHTQVKVTLHTGATVQGTLKRVDDFTVSLTTADGQYLSFTRQGPQGVREVDIEDPLAQHRQLLMRYTDQDMHDVTAYLATLK